MGKRNFKEIDDTQTLEDGRDNNSSKRARSKEGIYKNKTDKVPALAAKARDLVDSVLQSVKLNASTEKENEKGKGKRKEVEETQGKKTIGLSETLSIEHAIGNLQAAIKTILETAPNNQQLKELELNAEGNGPEVLLALKRHKLSLAAQLKSLYENKKLPLFDQILQFESNNQVLHDDVEIKLDSASVAKAAVKVQESSGFPELPPIKDPAIRAQVFLHKSLVKDKLYLSKNEVIHAHNERLEFIGDSVLNNIMTLIVYNAFPDAEEGELSQLRTRLISNATLQKWSFQYGFEKELKLNVDDSVLKGRMKVYADVFEAYIGGLVTESSDNYPIIYNWLKRLAAPILVDTNDAVAERVNSKEVLNTNAKVELYSLIGYAALGLRYEPVHKSIDKDITEFVVQVKTKEGAILGEGRGKNIKEAGMRAAMAALEDKAMIEKYSKIRASIPRDKSIRPVGIDPGKNKEEYLKGKENKSKDEYQRDRPVERPSSTGYLPPNSTSASSKNRRDYGARGNHRPEDNANNQAYSKENKSSSNGSKKYDNHIYRSNDGDRF